MAQTANDAGGRGLEPLPHPVESLRHSLLRSADLLPALLPDGVVGAGGAATVATVLQGRLPEGDVLEETVIAAVVVLVGRIADVLPKNVAGLRVARDRAVELGHLVLHGWRLGPLHPLVHAVGMLGVRRH